MTRALLLALCVCCLAGCTHSIEDPAVIEGNKVSLAADDADIAASTQKAQSTLDEFIEALKKDSKEEMLSIKVKVPTPGGSFEHMWLINPVYKDGKFSGTVDEDAFEIPNLKMGDKITVDREDVEDWLISRDGKFKGGFSIDAIAKRAGQPLLPR